MCIRDRAGLRGRGMEDREIVALYHARDEGAISETAAKYGAF